MYISHLSRLLGQHQLWLGDAAGVGPGGRYAPQLHRLVAGPAGQQAVVERREDKVGDGVGVAVNPRYGGLIGAAASRQRQDGEAGAQGVPVEGHVRGAGGDIVTT